MIDRLLAGPRYITHFTRVWRGVLMPEADQSMQARFQVPGFESWLSSHLTSNTPYDAMVRELLTTPVGNGNGQPVPFQVGAQGRPNPVGYYFAKDLLPENLADATARQFLGVRLGCAQCHNHPFAEWKREQFWEFAAFFSGVRRQQAGDFVQPAPEKPDLHQIAIPNTDRKVEARFLDGSVPKWAQDKQARAVLANWVTAPDNPYFARAAVNRMWAHLFGTGIVDPVDDMAGGETVASHPELLDELAREFVAHKYDLKFLIGALTRTRAYQLSSKRTHPGQDDPRLFARAALRGMTPEQLFDSLVEATAYRDDGLSAGPGVAFVGQRNIRADFLSRFNNASDRPTETQTSILQALTLMNGHLTADATSLTRSETLAALLDFPFQDTERIEVLYLAALARKPSDKEMKRALDFIAEASAGSADDSAYKKAIADVFWALLNSSEFFLNH